MSNKKIYSYKASGNGCRVSGRVCATNMSDATNQVLEEIKGYGQMNVRVTELKNQKKAMAEWLEDQELIALAEKAKNEKRIRVSIDDL